MIQDETRWLDLDGFADVACWIDIAEVTPPGGSSNSLSLALETAPVCDEAYFAPVAPPTSVGTSSQFNEPSPTPIVVRSLSLPSSSNSMRYLRWKITPSATGLWDLTFRVRAVGMRSSGFVPTDLSGCELWLRADAGITLNANTVSQWNDLSGNGRNLTQATSTQQPTYAPTSQGVLNGLPALSFNQTSLQILATPTTYSFHGAAAIFSAVHPVAGSSLNNRIFETLWSNGYYLGAGGSVGQNWRAIIDGTFGTAAGTSGAGDYIVSVNYDGTNGLLYQNGSRAASDPYPAPSSVANPLTVGGNAGGTATHDFFNGYIAEIIFFSRALTSSELTRVHRYLGCRYGIGVP